MTCYDKSLPSPDGRCSRRWCINWLQLVALRIIHENTYVHTLVHFVFFFMQKRRPRLRGWPWGHNSLLDSTRYGLNTGNVVPRVRPVRAIIYLWSHFTTFFFTYIHIRLRRWPGPHMHSRYVICCVWWTCVITVWCDVYRYVIWIGANRNASVLNLMTHDFSTIQFSITTSIHKQGKWKTWYISITECFY